MSYCITCGRKNEPSAKFCINCGSTLDLQFAGTGVSQLPAQPYPAVAGQQINSMPAGTDFNLANWFSKNKLYVISATGIIFVIWVVNYFFFKPHPDKDGTAVAKAECSCEEQRMNDFINNRKEFLQKFDTYRFTNVFDARRKLDSLDAVIQLEYNACVQQTGTLRDKKIENYSNDNNSLSVFQQQYYIQKQLCHVNNDDLSKVTADVSNKFLNFSPYLAHSSQPPVKESTDPVKADPEVATALNEPATANGTLTDAFIKNQITELYNQENNISSSPDDINKLMAYFEFPLDRYYDAKKVGASQLFKIYSDSYFKSLSSHYVKDFEDKITISRQTDGSVKVIVGCTFEFSTSQSPGDKRSRNVFNVYVMTQNGLIKSVYQLL